MTGNILITILFCICLSTAKGQEPSVDVPTEVNLEIPDKPDEPSGNYASIGFGSGLLTFLGDAGENSSISSLADFRMGHRISFNKRFGNSFGAYGDVTLGKISKNERTLTRNLNFESKIYSGAIGATYYFDNDYLFKRSSSLAPFLSLGVGYLMYNSFMDSVLDKTNQPYYYWTDGSIRNLPETPDNLFFGQYMTRDYKYETAVSKGGTIIIPAGVGMTLKLSEKFYTEGGVIYYTSLSDELDNFKAGSNDNVLYTHLTIRYNFGAKTIYTSEKTDDQRYNEINFNNLDYIDSDADGVTDLYDKCPGTPEGIQVDRSGCPLDSDGDGIADYLDQEPNTPGGSTVDQYGKALTDADLEKISEKYDGDIALRKYSEPEGPDYGNYNPVRINPGTGYVEEFVVNPLSKIPATFQPADRDGDGFLSAKEVSFVITEFLEGKAKYSADKIYHLIDFFFEQ